MTLASCRVRTTLGQVQGSWLPSPLALCGALLIQAGCSDGVGRPLLSDDRAEANSGGLPGDGSEGGANGAEDGGSVGMDAGDAGYCDATEDWPESAAATEQVIITALNVVRRLGVSCNGAALGEASAELRLEPELVCAARLHSHDMVERDFFAHINPDGEGPEARIRRTGYVFGLAGEAIGHGALEDLVLQDGEECRALVDPAFEAAGVGVYEDLWTIVLTGP